MRLDWHVLATADLSVLALKYQKVQSNIRAVINQQEIVPFVVNN